MKRILVLMLVVALCLTALTSCKLLGKKDEDTTLSQIAEMYSKSAPTKVVTVTKQTIAGVELNCSYELVTGYVDNKNASVYTETIEQIRTVEEGGNTNEVKDLIKTTTKKTEAVEGFGARTNGGDWNPQGTIWVIGRGRMALNLDESCLNNVAYENHTLTFTVSAANAGTVLGAEYATDIEGDVSVTIVDDGAVITSIELHYFLKGEGNVVASEMSVKVVYTYDLERITID